MCMYRFAENVHFVGGDKYLIFDLCLFSDMSFDINKYETQTRGASNVLGKQTKSRKVLKVRQLA